MHADFHPDDCPCRDCFRYSPLHARRVRERMHAREVERAFRRSMIALCCAAILSIAALTLRGLGLL